MKPRDSPPGIVRCTDGSLREEPAECTSQHTLPGPLRLALSKRLSGILRHFPHRYGISLDKEGWAPLEQLLQALRQDPRFSWVEEWHIRAIVQLDPKGRFELRGNRIRARYGHSIPVHIEPQVGGPPPPTLYHATPTRNLPSITREGLKPGKRTHVHLTSDPQLAIEIGKRHHPQVTLLEIETTCLQQKGIPVEKRAPQIYVALRVPPDCIKQSSTHEKTRKTNEQVKKQK